MKRQLHNEPPKSQVVCKVDGAGSLLLFFCRRLWRGRRGLRWRCRRRVRGAGHTFLKAANAFAEPLHDFRDALSAKENQNDGQNDHPVKNTELTHEPPPRPNPVGAPIPTLAQSFLWGKTVLHVTPIG